MGILSSETVGRIEGCCKSKSSSLPERTKEDVSEDASTSKTSRTSSFLYFSAYIYIPVLLLSAVIQYFGGVNEAMVAGMTFTYRHYGTLHGYASVISDTENGRVKGFTSYSREGREFYEFLGIPYATPPIGDLRFKAPLPPLSWDGVRDATGFGPACTQYDLFLQAVMGEEDCLTLNVFTPKLNTTDGKSLPVVIFIHGGMYHFGRAMDFRGHHFMDEDVVLVTINYRLQAFGFLNTGDGTVRGNMGLKDQVAAMKWVQKNIHHFGGNPNLVTIWGESAGGASTHFHALSPMSKGLFHRAISNSGFSLAHWSFIRKPAEQARLFARRLNCPTHSTNEMVTCLRKVPSYKIAEIFRGNHDVLHPRLDVFAPTIESGSNNENDTETFLHAHPRELLRRGEIVSRVPMINGANSHEGLIYAGYFVRNQTVSNTLNTQWKTHAPVLLDFEDLAPPMRNAVSDRIWNSYIGPNNTMGMDTLYNVVNLFSDTSFFKPMEESALSLGKALPLYLYIYNHKGEFGVAQGYFRLTMWLPMSLDGLLTTGIQMVKKHLFGIEEKHWGVCHADEMAVFFKMHPLLSRISKGHREYKFSKEMVKSWAHFAKHGSPLPFQGHNWTKVRPGEPLQYMKLDSAQSPGMVHAPWGERLKGLSKIPGFQCFEDSSKDPICI